MSQTVAAVYFLNYNISQHLNSHLLTSAHLTDLEKDISDDEMKKFINRQSHWHLTSYMSVVYEQQSWEDKIIKQINVKQECRKLCKQYLI